MNEVEKSDDKYTRRNFIRAGIGVSAGLMLPPIDAAGQKRDKKFPTANGGTDPFPIPWLDKNGSHNQPAGENLEPSHIYHFKGQIARCSTFTGMGTDNKGNRIAFGTATTDFGYMQGEYWAARAAQKGTFTHI
ncbi:MAG TPA: hypothetical protein VF556_13870 [Pyrinomonadaceae bacterium]|jgi:hypothetical protein